MLPDSGACISLPGNRVDPEYLKKHGQNFGSSLLGASSHDLDTWFITDG